MVEVGGRDVGRVPRTVDGVDRDDVGEGFVDVVGIDVGATVDDVARGALVDGAAGSVVDVVRAIPVPGVTCVDEAGGRR